jgi:archaemetzincin
MKGTVMMLLMGLTAARSAKECTIAVAPVGDVPREVIEELLPLISDAFRCRAVAAPPVALSAAARDPARGQYLSNAVLDSLAAARRPEWERLLGVTDVDLFVPELNFVFGQGDARRGVAVFSFARLRPTEPGNQASTDLFARRAAIEAIHELGHTYGLAHCRRPDCVMWFSNTLAESDRKGPRFCPEHATQLAHATR